MNISQHLCRDARGTFYLCPLCFAKLRWQGTTLQGFLRSVNAHIDSNCFPAVYTGTLSHIARRDTCRHTQEQEHHE